MADHVVSYTAFGSLEKFIDDIDGLKKALKDLQGDYKKDTKAVKQNSRALKENEEALTDSQKAARGRKAALNGEKVAVEDLAAATRVLTRETLYRDKIKQRAKNSDTSLQKAALKLAEQIAKQAEIEAARTQAIAENRQRIAKIRKDEYSRTPAALKAAEQTAKQAEIEAARTQATAENRKRITEERKNELGRERESSRIQSSLLAHSKAITTELLRQKAIETDRALAYRRQQGQVAVDQARASNAAAAASATGGGSSSTTAVGGGSKGSDGGFGKGSLLGGGGGGGVPGFYKLKSGAMGVAVLGIVSGLQALNSALFAVGGSVVVFAQALSQLGGIAATIPGGIFAVAGAVTASIFAFQGFGTAFKLFNEEFGPEAPQTYAEALNRLSPSGKKVVETLTGMSSKFREMKKDVQEATFAPIAKEIEKVNRLVPVLGGVLTTIGTSLGKVGAQFIKTFTTKAWQASFSKLGDSSGKVIESLGMGALSLAEAFGNIAVAARPLTEFVGSTMRGLSDDLKGWSETLSGGSFATAGTRLTQFISIFKSLGSVVKSTFEAAAPVTDWFMKRFTEVSKGWADSAKNSGGLKKFFQELQPVMSATSKLFGEVFRQLAARVDFPGLVQVIEAIQGQLLPALLGVFDTFGDTENLLMFIELLSNAVEAATAIFGPISAGFKTVLQVLNPVLDVLTAIASTSLGGLVLGLMGAYSAARLLLTPLIRLPNVLAAIAMGYRAIAGSAAASATAQKAASATSQAPGFAMGQIERKQAKGAKAAKGGGGFMGGGAGGLVVAAAMVAAVAAAGKLSSSFNDWQNSATGAIKSTQEWKDAFAEIAAGGEVAISNLGHQMDLLVSGPLLNLLSGSFAGKGLEEQIQRIADPTIFQKMQDGIAGALGMVGIGDGVDASVKAIEENLGNAARAVQELTAAGDFDKARAGLDGLVSSAEKAGVPLDQLGERVPEIAEAFADLNDKQLSKGLENIRSGADFDGVSAGIQKAVTDAAKFGIGIDQLTEKMPQLTGVLEQYGTTLQEFNTDPTARAKVGFQSYFDTLVKGKESLKSLKQAQQELEGGAVSDRLEANKYKTQDVVRTDKSTGAQVATSRGADIAAQMMQIEQLKQAETGMLVPMAQVNAQYEARKQKLLSQIPVTQANAYAIQQMNASLGQSVAVVTMANGKTVTIPVSSPGALPTAAQLLKVNGAAVSADGKSVTIPTKALDAGTLATLKNVEGAAVSANGKKVTVPIDAIDNATPKLEDTASAADTVEEQDTNANINTNAGEVTGQIQGVISTLAALNGQTAIATVIINKVGGSNLGGPITALNGGGVLHARSGSFVPGPQNVDRDIVPAMLTPGEFVLRKSAVKKLGVPFLEYLNRSGEMEGYKKGGKVKKKDKFPKLTKKINRLNKKNKPFEKEQDAQSKRDRRRQMDDLVRENSRLGAYRSEAGASLAVARENAATVSRNVNATAADRAAALAEVNRALIAQSDVETQAQARSREYSLMTKENALDEAYKAKWSGKNKPKNNPKTKAEKKKAEKAQKEAELRDAKKQLLQSQSGKADTVAGLQRTLADAARLRQIAEADVLGAKQSALNTGLDINSTPAQRAQAQQQIASAQRAQADQEQMFARAQQDLGALGAPVPAADAAALSLPAAPMQPTALSPMVSAQGAGAVNPAPKAGVQKTVSKGGAGKSVSIGNIYVTNPSPEPASQSINKRIQLLTSREV